MYNIQISNVTSLNSVQRYVCRKFTVSDTSLEGIQAYWHYVVERRTFFVDNV